MPHQLRRAGFALCFALMACSAAPDSSVVPTATTRSSALTSRMSSPTAPTARQLLPPPLVGDWESAGGDTTLAYRFTGDGRFAFAGVMTQPRGEGFYQFTRTEMGTAVVRDSVVNIQRLHGV